MDLLNKIIKNLITHDASDANVEAAEKQLCAVADLIGEPYDPATTAEDGATVANQVPRVRNLAEGSLISGENAKECLREAYALLVTATQVIPT